MKSRVNIVESQQEPNKKDLWLNNNKLKKFTSKGWEEITSKGKNSSSGVLFINCWTHHDNLPKEWGFRWNNFGEYGGFCFKREDMVKLKYLASNEIPAILVVHDTYNGSFEDPDIEYWRLISKDPEMSSMFNSKTKITASDTFHFSTNVTNLTSTGKAYGSFEITITVSNIESYDENFVIEDFPDASVLSSDIISSMVENAISNFTTSITGTRDTSANTITLDTRIPTSGSTDVQECWLRLDGEEDRYSYGPKGRLISKHEFDGDYYTIFYFHFGSFILKILGYNANTPLPYEQIDLISTT